MATGGGARAWLFFRRNDEYGALWRTLAGAAPVFEDAPFPIRGQAQANLAVACFGLARGGARRDSPRPQAAHRAAHRSCPGCGKAAKPAARGRCHPPA